MFIPEKYLAFASWRDRSLKVRFISSLHICCQLISCSPFQVRPPAQEPVNRQCRANTTRFAQLIGLLRKASSVRRHVITDTQVYKERRTQFPYSPYTRSISHTRYYVKYTFFYNISEFPSHDRIQRVHWFASTILQPTILSARHLHCWSEHRRFGGTAGHLALYLHFIRLYQVLFHP